MNVINGFPPNIEEIKAVLPIRKNTVYTYGDTIYAPGIDFALSEDLQLHELVHSLEQQKTSPDKWWKYYLEDEQFRFNQELIAYKIQYDCFRSSHSRDESRKFVKQIAQDLSSDMYGYCVTFLNALIMIRS